jgi:hypothetical protein
MPCHAIPKRQKSRQIFTPSTEPSGLDRAVSRPLCCFFYPWSKFLLIPLILNLKARSWRAFFLVRIKTETGRPGGSARRILQSRLLLPPPIRPPVPEPWTTPVPPTPIPTPTTPTARFCGRACRRRNRSGQGGYADSGSDRRSHGADAPKHRNRHSCDDLSQQLAG